MVSDIPIYDMSMARERIRILFLAANPIDQISLQLYREFESIDDAIYSAKYKNKFELIPRFSVNADRILSYLIRFKPNIIHFSGHGTVSGHLIFENKIGKTFIADKKAIQTIFRVLKQDIKCIVLNSCFSQRQANLLIPYVDCIIGMSNEINDYAAYIFAKNFYTSLSGGFDLYDSYTLAKNQVLLEPIQYENISLDMKKQSKMIKLITKKNNNIHEIALINKGKRI